MPGQNDWISPIFVLPPLQNRCVKSHALTALRSVTHGNFSAALLILILVLVLILVLLAAVLLAAFLILVLVLVIHLEFLLNLVAVFPQG